MNTSYKLLILLIKEFQKFAEWFYRIILSAYQMDISTV